MINLVFDSPSMYVIDYPGEDTVEILDKRCGRVGIVRGALASRFRHDFGILLAQQAGEEEFDDFFDGYDAVITQSTRLQ